MPGKKARGVLVAVDGLRTADLAAGAKTAMRTLAGKGGVSTWDASGIFFELERNQAQPGIRSARMLLLLYAADLAFRLRWEIEPALDAGMNVAAAPYVDTAVAFGRAAGLPAKWLRDLFEFAPAATGRHRVEASTRRGAAGFIDTACTILGDTGTVRARAAELLAPANLRAK